MVKPGAAGLGGFLKKNAAIYLMLLPAVAYFVVFNYYPLIYAVDMSFRHVFIANSSNRVYVGLDNYLSNFQDVHYWYALRNTFIFAFWNCFLGVVLSGAVAILLNEVRSTFARRFVQTTIYLPNLLSWVVVGSAFLFMLSPNIGPVNQIARLFGFDASYNWFNDVGISRGLIISINQWKITGYGVIIYMAALVSIPPEQYESALIDGANRFHRIFYVTIPNLSNTIMVMIMLNVIGMFQLFDPIYVLSNRVTMNQTDVIMTYIYRTALGKIRLGQGASASVVILVLSLAFTLLAKRITRFGFED